MAFGSWRSIITGFSFLRAHRGQVWHLFALAPVRVLRGAGAHVVVQELQGVRRVDRVLLVHELGENAPPPGQGVVVALAVGQDAQVLEVDDVVVDSGAREQVPPRVELEENAKRQAQEGAADVAPEGAEKIVEVPHQEAQQEDGDAEGHGVAEVALGALVLDVAVGHDACREHDHDVQDGVGGLVDGRVAVHQVHHGEDGGGEEHGRADHDLLGFGGLGVFFAAAQDLGLLAENAPGRDASGVDHGELVEQLVLVAQRHVEEPGPDADGAESEPDHDEPGLEVVAQRGVGHEHGEQHEEPVGDGVGPLGDERRHDVVFLTPVDGRGGRAPVPDFRGFGVRSEKGV